MIVTLPDRSVQVIERGECRIEELLEQFGINPLDVVISINGRIVPEDTRVGSDDRIRIIRIAHGG